MWSELKDGLTFSSNGAFCTFFFFFFWISAWIGRFGNFGRYGRFRSIHARIGPIPRESARFGAASARVGFKKMKATWDVAAGRGRLRGQWRPSRVAASHCVGRGCGTSGAATVLHKISLYFWKKKKKKIIKRLD